VNIVISPSQEMILLLDIKINIVKLKIMKNNEKCKQSIIVNNSNNSNNSNNVNNVNNVHNVNITNNNTINVINVNGFGKENLSYVTDWDKKCLCEFSGGFITEYIKYVHLNPNHPENHNIRMKSHKRNEVYIYYEDKGWWVSNLQDASEIVFSI
jgi:hypothetical protein